MGKLLAFVALVFILLTGSCKNSGKTNENKAFIGKWDLIYWNNTQDSGMIVFTDSLLYFNKSFTTEISKYTLQNDTLRTLRVGGNMSYLSTYDYWLVDKVDSVFFKIVSSGGNIVTAYKAKKFWGIKDGPDTAYVTF